jgi:hypothetical protein
MEEKMAFKDLINNHNHIFHYEKNRLFRMIGEEGVLDTETGVVRSHIESTKRFHQMIALSKEQLRRRE